MKGPAGVTKGGFRWAETRGGKGVWLKQGFREGIRGGGNLHGKKEASEREERLGSWVELGKGEGPALMGH